MAKAKKETGPGFDKDGIPCPNPAPKVGDAVNYIWPPGATPLPLGGTIRSAKVLAVYEGFDGRLVDLEVSTPKEPVTVKSVPWRDAEDNAGNTWHQPATE